MVMKSNEIEVPDWLLVLSNLVTGIANAAETFGSIFCEEDIGGVDMKSNDEDRLWQYLPNSDGRNRTECVDV